MASDSDPWSLVLAHHYGEALVIFDGRRGPDSGALEAANRSTALLCLGRLSEALAGFRTASERAIQESRGESRAYQAEIGAILWLLGRRDEAIATFRAAVDGVLDGSIKYADNAGGVGQGLLLWYAGVTTRDGAATEHSLKYLRKLAKRPRIKYWPGPLALLALGQKTEQEVLLEACGSSDLDVAIKQASADLLKRRELAQSLFYFGVRKRSEGHEEGCRQRMITCARLENPILEAEWYLARAEAGLAIAAQSPREHDLNPGS
jgi:tetratricopeptide (TPR) repeat protein